MDYQYKNIAINRQENLQETDKNRHKRTHYYKNPQRNLQNAVKYRQTPYNVLANECAKIIEQKSD